MGWRSTSPALWCHVRAPNYRGALSPSPSAVIAITEGTPLRAPSQARHYPISYHFKERLAASLVTPRKQIERPLEGTPVVLLVGRNVGL
jgi:hypothetical protein